MRHCGRAFLPLLKRLLRFTHFGSLEVPDLGCHLIERTRGYRDRRHVFGMAVALKALQRVLDFVGSEYHLRDFDDVKAARGF